MAKHSRSRHHKRHHKRSLRGGLSSRIKNGFSNAGVGGLFFGRAGAATGALLGAAGNVGFFKDKKSSRRRRS